MSNNNNTNNKNCSGNRESGNYTLSYNNGEIAENQLNRNDLSNNAKNKPVSTAQPSNSWLDSYNSIPDAETAGASSTQPATLSSQRSSAHGGRKEPSAAPLQTASIGKTRFV